MMNGYSRCHGNNDILYLLWTRARKKQLQDSFTQRKTEGSSPLYRAEEAEGSNNMNNLSSLFSFPKTLVLANNSNIFLIFSSFIIG